jgi:tRNA (guanine37-N1)-methyltransferase
MGAAASAEEESFSAGLLEYPHYTRPAEWQGRRAPDILLSGNHQAVREWRHAEALRVTRERRPDLWAAYQNRLGAGCNGQARAVSPSSERT